MSAFCRPASERHLATLLGCGAAVLLLLQCAKQERAVPVRATEAMKNVPAPGGPQKPCRNVHELNVQLVPQHMPNWCWAASAEMVMKTVPGGREVKQCEQASHKLGIECCQEPVSGECDKPGWPNFEGYGFTHARRKGALSWQEIKDQIDCKEAPIAFTWASDRREHMMTLGGYLEEGDTQWVTVYDPLDVDHGDIVTISYDAYKGGPDYSHRYAYYDVAAKP